MTDLWLETIVRLQLTIFLLIFVNSMSGEWTRLILRTAVLALTLVAIIKAPF